MKNWKAILGVVGIFVLGALAGGLVTHRVYQKRIRAYLRSQAAVPTELIVRQMSAELKLTDEQRAQLLPILNDTRERLQQIRAQTEPQVREAFHDSVRRIREILTPEQRTKFDRQIADHKARWPKMTFSPPQRLSGGGVREQKKRTIKETQP